MVSFVSDERGITWPLHDGCVLHKYFKQNNTIFVKLYTHYRAIILHTWCVTWIMHVSKDNCHHSQCCHALLCVFVWDVGFVQLQHMCARMVLYHSTVTASQGKKFQRYRARNEAQFAWYGARNRACSCDVLRVIAREFRGLWPISTLARAVAREVSCYFAWNYGRFHGIQNAI